jgi:hypothetical protein
MVGAPCNDGDAGTLNDRCFPNGGCYGQQTAQGCDNGNVCDGIETLDPLLGCQPGEPLNCFDFCAGQFGPGCDPFAGCQVQEAPICDLPDDCIIAECGGLFPSTDGCVVETQSCDDGNPCTIDECDGVGGCVHKPVPDGQVCDDGSACTTADACVAGVCRGVFSVFCDPCHGCDADTGACGLVLCDDVPPVNDPFADFDGDGDVDHVDFSVWQKCFTGSFSDVDYLGACMVADWDGDGAVDLKDLEVMNPCFSGPNIPADKTCDDPMPPPSN